MRGLLGIVVPLALLLSLGGCCSARLKALADGVEAGYSEVIREYEAIVIDGKPRPNFTEEDKQLRRASLARVKSLLEEARK